MAVAVACAHLVGCGDNDGARGRPDAAPVVDAGQSDAALCPATPAPGELGGTCTGDADCDSVEGAGDGWCITGWALGMWFPDTGYCTRTCAEAEASCGGLSACFDQADFPGTLCFPLCASCADALFFCGEGLSCRGYVADHDLGAHVCMPGVEGAAIGAPCTSIADCDGLCEPDQSGTTGLCTARFCDPEFDCAQLEDAACVDPDGDGGEPSYCVDRCETTEDCATEDGQRCADGGQGIGRICRHSVIGDPCESDGECGQAPWSCSPGGACTIPCGDGCPDGTVCNDGGSCEPAI